MMGNDFKKSSNFVIYLNEYASSKPAIFSKASLPTSVAEIISNKTLIIPEDVQETIHLEETIVIDG